MNKKTVMAKAAAYRTGRAPELPDRPDLAEVFRLDDDGSGAPMFFDVQRLRAWVKTNLEPTTVRIEQWRAERLIKTGAVEPHHLVQHTIRHKPDPVIVCREAGGPGEDAIVDGAHRYVAAALGAAMIGETKMGYGAYILSPDEWRPFVLSGTDLAVMAGAK